MKKIPGARVVEVGSYLKLLAEDNHKYNKTIIHVGSNDNRLCQLEVMKFNVELVCTYSKTMSDSIVFSGPLPDLTSADIYGLMSSFNHWLARWCPTNNVGFVEMV